MADGALGGHQKGFAKTMRTDAWWFEPLWTGLGFLIFSLYATWEMFDGRNYFVGGHDPTSFGGYISPFFSPLLFTDTSVWAQAPIHHAFFGERPSFWPSWFPSISSALILPLPLSFRLTCYYYRKFYYRAYFFTPPACAVGAAPQPGRYLGERGLLVLQNLHRYALYTAVVVIGFLSYDAFMSFFRDGHFGVGVGSLVLTINPILLGTYTFGCHALRHLVGGSKDCYGCDRFDAKKGTTSAHKRWKLVTWLNERHMFFAWVSMIWVGGAAWYVRLVASGTIHDFNTWGY